MSPPSEGDLPVIARFERRAEDGAWQVEEQYRRRGRGRQRLASRMRWRPGGKAGLDPDRWEFSPWVPEDLNALPTEELIAKAATWGWPQERVSRPEDRVVEEENRVHFSGEWWSFDFHRRPVDGIPAGRWNGVIEVHGVPFEWRRLPHAPDYDQMLFAALMTRFFLERVKPAHLAAWQQQKVLTLKPDAPTPHARGGRVLVFPGTTAPDQEGT